MEVVSLLVWGSALGALYFLSGFLVGFLNGAYERSKRKCAPGDRRENPGLDCYPDDR